MDVLISAERIEQRLVELAAKIGPEYHDHPLTIIGVLNGSLMFLADLVRHLDVPLRIGFIQASSYRGAVTTPGELHVGAEIQADIRGRHVLLLDDILDTGQTIKHLTRHLLDQGAVSVKVGVLLRKAGRQLHAVTVDYVGFDIPDEFVVGFGLDYNDEYRHLPHVAILPRSVYEGKG